MSLLRRIVQNPTVAPKAVPVTKTFIPYPLGRDAYPLQKLKPDPNNIYMDRRPICLRHRVTTMIEMSNLDAASMLSRLAVLDKFRVDRDTVFICNSVIGAMCEAKRYDEATSLFNYFFNECKTLRNMLSCNLIIKSCCDRGRVDDALELYRHIVLLHGSGHLSPGIETYRILTKALVDAKRFDEACDLVVSMNRLDIIVYNILIRGFLEAGKFVRANQIFEELKGPNSKLSGVEYHKAITIFNVSFMEYWFKQGKDEEAMEIYATLDKNQVMNYPVVPNMALKVLMEHGKKTEARDLFREMIAFCDAEAFDIMLKGCSEIKISFKGVRKTCYRTIIARLCELGNISEAEKLFAEMLSDVERDDLMLGPDVSTYRAMINGYVKVGRVDDAIKTLNQMKLSNLRKLAIHQA